MDAIDHRILRELQADARISHQELGDRVGLSASPCARRIQRLEAQGLIEGYSARISEAKMGYGFSVFVSVRLDRQIDDRMAGFERSIRDYSEVVDCWLMTGSFDYLLRIAVADLAEFETFLTGKLTKVAGVALIESSIPIRRVKTRMSRIS